MSNGFAHFVGLTDIIDEPGFYETRCGGIVSVHYASKRHDFGCKGQYSEGFVEGWHKSGRLYFLRESDNDIVRKL